ncbi:hypothetical protein FACS1894110_24370 [Spirochaetia bacterium]|nr:hypothetical protein FACS1894110_24370 [Spirochaetia bacterium]
MLGIENLIKRLSAGSGKKTGARKTPVKRMPVKVSVRDLGDPFASRPVRKYSPMRSPFREAQQRSAEMPHKRKSMQRRSSKPEAVTVIKNRDELARAKFVCKAIDRSDKRPFTQVLHVEQNAGGSILVATDGKRLHVAHIKTRIPEGDYKPLIAGDAVKLCNPVDCVDYPDWQRVVPETAKKKGTIGLDMVGGKNAGRGRMVIGEACRDIKGMTGAKLDPEFVAGLSGHSWDVYAPSAPEKPLLLFETGSDKETYAVIMPILSIGENNRPTQRMPENQTGKRRASQAA